MPGPGHSKYDRSLSLLLVGKRIIYHSFAGDPDHAILEHLGLRDDEQQTVAERRQARHERAAAERATKERASNFCKRVWSEAGPIEGTPVEAYLSRRGVSVVPADTRFHPAAPTSYARRAACAAMVVLLRDQRGAARAIQSTFIKPNGEGKAFAGSSRLTFGPLRGSAVRLAAPRAGVLGIAEGMETALSFLQLYGIPTWAALGTANLATFTPPAGIRELYIAADRGTAGEEAARKLKAGLVGMLPCDVRTPPPGYGDWNDVLLTRKELF